MKIPFVPFSQERVKAIGSHYLGWGERFSGGFLGLESELEQAGFDFEPREWLGVAVYSFLSWFSVLFAFVFGVGFLAALPVLKTLLLSFFVALGVGFAVFFYTVFYPKLFVGRRVKDIEKNLPAVLHHLLVKVRSGVPLFNTFVSIGRGGYGALSEELQKAVNEINTGKSDVEALEMLARNNPSLQFRRIVWQLVNAIKTGADIGNTLKEIVDMITTEQRTEIKKYGAQLNPLILFYLVLVVIFPTLGITFLLMLATFIGIAFDINFMLIGILGLLLVFQFIFISLIKSRRPVGI